MFTEIIKITGKKEGPTSVIMAGVHGNERCGIEALDRILPFLRIESGRVLFGYGNPRAIEMNQRFVEENLNRMFLDDGKIPLNAKKSYEYQRSRFLKKYLDQADALLDIHASRTPQSQPFIICESNAEQVARYLPVDLIVSGFDKIQPGGTDYYMNSRGKIGICVESGYINNENSLTIAEKSIEIFLKARGHINNDLKPRQKSYIRVYSLYKTQSDDFQLVKQFADFEAIKRDQLIARDGAKEIRAKKNSVILFARNQNRAGAEGFLLGQKKSLT